MKKNELSRADEAREQMEKGFSCAPAILSAYSEELGLDRALALKVACGFGGGIGRMGRTCGAVTGAIMAIGLKHGQVSVADEESRRRTHKLVKELVDRFTALHGSIECRELIGYDLGKAAELKAARESGVFRDKCPAFVYETACILEDILSFDEGRRASPGRERSQCLERLM